MNFCSPARDLLLHHITEFVGANGCHFARSDASLGVVALLTFSHHAAFLCFAGFGNGADATSRKRAAPAITGTAKFRSL